VSSDTLDPSKAETFPQLVRSAAKAYGDRPAIALKGETLPDETITFTGLDRQSALIARGLLARGVGKGSRVGFIYGNGPSFGIMFAAIARIGAVAVPISTMIKANELVRVLRQSDVSGLILQRSLLGKDYVERICDALPGLADADSPDLRLKQVPFLRWIVSSGDGLPASIRDLGWLEKGAESVSEELLAEIESEVTPADQIMEIYTSGSMALPKGVKHNHGPTMFRTHYLRKMSDISAGEEKLVPLPMFWVGGMMVSLLPNWEIGAVSLCMESNHTDSRTAMGVVLADDDLARYPKLATNWALGMTETLGPYSYGDQFRVPGYPLCTPLDHIADGYEVRVVNDEGQPVKDGEIGEVQVRGYPLTPGLHKLESSAYLEPDGFYRTGDLGLVEGSRIHFIGRDGDMIKTAGANVSPAEVEMEIQQSEGVHSAYVFGIPDRERGELVVAAVIPRDGVELDFAALQQELRQRLSGYKVPREYVSIGRDEVPMLHSNKVARRQLREILIQRLGR